MLLSLFFYCIIRFDFQNTCVLNIYQDNIIIMTVESERSNKMHEYRMIMEGGATDELHQSGD